MFEVERKVNIEGEGALEAFERRIRAAGAVKHKELEFTDVYFDTSDLCLTAADHWLRTRDGVWELKVGAPTRNYAQ